MRRAQWIGAVLLGAAATSQACSGGTSNGGSGAAAGSSTAGSANTGATGGDAGAAGEGTGVAGEDGGGAAGASGASSRAGAANGGAANGGAANGGAANGGAANGGSSGAAGDGAGAGGQAGDDPCLACPGLCSPGGQCVACLPSNDQCPSGQYCTADSYTCVPGCKDASSCASGVCGADHDCQNCIADTECSAGEVCGNNQCAPPCTEAAEGSNTGCGTGLTCCGLHCIDDTNQSGDCGACGTACGATSFCGTSSCRTTTLSSLCAIGKVALVLDDVDDDAASRAIGAALVSSCTPTPSEREIDQSATTEDGVANASTGQPVAGADELLVVAGGAYFAHVSNFTEAGSVAPLYAQQDNGMDEYVSRASGTAVVSFPNVDDPAHYYFVVQFMRDPASGSLILNVQGYFANATAIGASYFASTLAPELSTLTKSWYAYEWQDANADQMAQPTEVTLVASGP